MSDMTYVEISGFQITFARFFYNFGRTGTT